MTHVNTRKSYRKRVKPLISESQCQQVSIAATKSLAGCLYTSAGTSLGSHLASHVNGSGAEIVSASLDPKGYRTAEHFSRDYLCVELMSKFPFWDLGIDRRKVALGKFRDAERQCTQANRRLVDFGSNSLITVGTQQILLSAKRKIQNLLGPLSILECLDRSRYGPGATATKKRRYRDVYYKVDDRKPSCTYNLVPLVHLYRDAFPFREFALHVVPGSRVVTVPKSAKTDRTICAEPDLNVFFQLGIGKVLRSRLQRVGLLHASKNQAQRENAELAREGSSTGRLATIDLSSASDTISKELVRLLMPLDWLRFLEETRSPIASLEGSSYPLEKFSAMGNGYTFELETLIFWAICSSILDTNRRWDRRLKVYGDDIIIDSDAVGLLMEVFQEVGFSVNEKKSHWNGPFRESCGKHYFRGDDVSPFFIKKALSATEQWMWMANTIRRYARLSWGLDSRWKEAYDFCLRQISEPFHRLMIPDGYGDGGLIVDFDEATPFRIKAKDGIEGYLVSHLVPHPVLRQVKGRSRIFKSLYLLDLCEEGVIQSSVPIGIASPKEDSLIVKQWPSYGTWL